MPGRDLHSPYRVFFTIDTWERKMEMKASSVGYTKRHMRNKKIQKIAEIFLIGAWIIAVAKILFW